MALTPDEEDYVKGNKSRDEFFGILFAIILVLGLIAKMCGYL